MAIVGVSFDSPESNESWAEDEGFEFELWTDDDDRTLAIAYGAASSSSAYFADRVTKVIDADGILALEYSVSDVGTHPAQVLNDVTILFGD